MLSQVTSRIVVGAAMVGSRPSGSTTRPMVSVFLAAAAGVAWISARAAASTRGSARDRIRERKDMAGISPIEFSAKKVRNRRSRYHRPSFPAKPPKGPSPMITEIAVHHLSATELLDLYRRKALSPVEVTKAVLARIAHWEPSLK